MSISNQSFSLPRDFSDVDFQNLSCCHALLKQGKKDDQIKHFKEHVQRAEGYLRAQEESQKEYWKAKNAPYFKDCKEEPVPEYTYDGKHYPASKVWVPLKNKYDNLARFLEDYIRKPDCEDFSKKIIVPVSVKIAASLIRNPLEGLMAIHKKGESCNGKSYSRRILIPKKEEYSEKITEKLKSETLVFLSGNFSESSSIFRKRDGEAMWKGVILSEYRILFLYLARDIFNADGKSKCSSQLSIDENNKDSERLKNIFAFLLYFFEGLETQCITDICAVNLPRSFYEINLFKDEFRKDIENRKSVAVDLPEDDFDSLLPPDLKFTTQDISKLIQYSRKVKPEEKARYLALTKVALEFREEDKGVVMPVMEIILKELKELEGE